MKIEEKNQLLKDKIENIKSIIPECFVDGELNIKKLKDLFSMEEKEEKENYEFQWHGKLASKKGAYNSTTLTLKPNLEKSINFEKTKNIYIESDNLEALKILRDSYTNRVKMIYIDPPYNTEKDFVYPDNFVEPFESYQKLIGAVDEKGKKTTTKKDSFGRKHTNWLNMMYSRLLLARDFLTEDGVIFISINDYEFANLKKICDEVFFESNFIGMFVVNASPSAIDYGHIAKMNEYVLFYAKNIYETNTKLLEDPDKKFDYEDEEGGFNLYPLYNGNSAFNIDTRPNLCYPFYVNPIKEENSEFYTIDIEPHEGWEEVYPVVSQEGIQKVWRWGKEKALAGLNNEIVGYLTKDDGFRIMQKSRHKGKTIRSLQDGKLVSTRKGTLEIKELFDNKKVFSFPKPTELIRRFIEISTNENDIIMDFFSGSATTGHGTLLQNLKEVNENGEGGQRKFILVQMPELISKDQVAYKEGYRYITELGRARLERVFNQIKKDFPDIPLDYGFKTFELSETNFPEWNENLSKEEFEVQGELLLKSIENTYSAAYEILILLQDYLLDEKVEKLTDDLFSLGDNEKSIVYLGENLNDEAYQYILDNHQNYIKVVVYDNALNQNQKFNLSTAIGYKFETL